MRPRITSIGTSYRTSIEDPPAIAAARHAGHRVFASPDSVNLIMIRRPLDPDGRIKPGEDFGCEMTCSFRGADGVWHCYSWRANSIPGVGALEEPMRSTGTAVLEPGQYIGAYELGWHKGRAALVQRKPVKVRRDNTRDGFVDFAGPVEAGLFGINIHDGKDRDWSAGCQLLNVSDLAVLLDLCASSARLYGPAFSYTLLTDEAFETAMKETDQ